MARSPEEIRAAENNEAGAKPKPTWGDFYKYQYEAANDTMAYSSPKVTLPKWDPADVDWWFYGCEAQFSLVKPPLGDEQKLAFMMGVVPSEVMRLYKADVQANNYAAVKAAMKSSNVKTDASLYEDFIRAKPVPGQTMGQFVQAQRSKLDQLSTTDLGAWLVKQSVERNLPDAVTTTMAGVAYSSTNSATATKYIKTLDNIMANIRQPAPASTAAVDKVVAAMEEAGLGGEVAYIRKAHGQKTGGRVGGRTTLNGGNGRKQKADRPDKRCWKHEKFGDKAHDCAAPTECPDRHRVRPKEAASMETASTY